MSAVNRPFVKKFRTKNFRYVYDVNTNEVITVSPLVYDLLDDIGVNDIDTVINKWRHRYSIEDIKTGVKGIEEMRRRHKLFSNHRPVIDSYYKSPDDVKKGLADNLFQLTLEVTSRCNLRCKYCTFSGRYPGFRGHGTEDMSLDTAHKAVDFFIGQNKGKPKNRRSAISFYGGEPLIKFGLIKDIIDYARKISGNGNLAFSFTTNGTLLTEDILNFLVENDIALLVSLDGPKKITDRFRVFPNGKGAYDTILENLERIKVFSPDYFKEKVSINAVITPPYPIEQVIRFFNSAKPFKPIADRARLSFVNDSDTTFFTEFGLEKEGRDINDELIKLRDKYKRALIQGRYDRLTLEKSFFLEDFHSISRRRLMPLPDRHPPLGMCLPGQRRIFVSTKGNFYMCEKVGTNYEIGDVERGFDHKKIFDLLTAYDAFFKDCGNCWALRLCKKCFSVVRKGDRLDEEKRAKVCGLKLNNLEANLITYCEIMEESPDAFNVYKNVVMT